MSWHIFKNYSNITFEFNYDKSVFFKKFSIIESKPFRRS